MNTVTLKKEEWEKIKNIIKTLHEVMEQIPASPVKSEEKKCEHETEGGFVSRLQGDYAPKHHHKTCPFCPKPEERKSPEEIAREIIEGLIQYDQWRDNLHPNDFSFTKKAIADAIKAERNQGSGE